MSLAVLELFLLFFFFHGMQNKLQYQPLPAKTEFKLCLTQRLRGDPAFTLFFSSNGP